MLDLRDGSSFSRNPGAGIRKKWAGKTGREYLPALPVQCAKNPWLLYGLSGQVFRLKRPARGFTFPTLSGQWQLRRRAAFLKLRSALTATGSPGNFTPVPVFGRGVSPRTPGVPMGIMIIQPAAFVKCILRNRRTYKKEERIASLPLLVTLLFPAAFGRTSGAVPDTPIRSSLGRYPADGCKAGKTNPWLSRSIRHVRHPPHRLPGLYGR